jgi:hypothetical protein
MIRGLLVLALILPTATLAKELIQHDLSEAEVKKTMLLSTTHRRSIHITAQAGIQSFALASGKCLARPIW